MPEGTAITLYDQAYDRIRADILAGTLAPGQPLRLAALAGQLGISMSVVREALSRLSAQGLVIAAPNQGFRVVPLSEDDLRDLTQVRADLECRALEQSIAHADLPWEGQVLSAHHVLDRTPLPGADSTPEQQEIWVAAHSAFHDSLIAGCGSPRLLGLVRSLRDSAEVYRQWSARPSAASGRDVVAEHRSLMELASDRQSGEASEALRAHIETTANFALTSRTMKKAPVTPRSRRPHPGRPDRPPKAQPAPR